MTDRHAPAAPAGAQASANADAIIKKDFLSEWRAGWKVLLAATIGCGTGFGLFLTTAGMFITPMQTDLRWSVTSLAIAPFVLLFSAILLPWGGMAIDRFGARPMAILGLSLMVLAYILFGLMPPSKIAFYAIGTLVAIAGPIAYFGAYLKIVGAWFKHNTGLALGISMAGLYASTMLFLPALGYSIDNWGWRSGYFLSAALVATIGLPVTVCYLKLPSHSEPEKRPTALPTLPESRQGATTGEALRDLRFWLLLVSCTSATLVLGGFVAHLQPLLRRIAYNAQEAANVGVIFAALTCVGRLAGGFLLDRFPPFRVAGLFLLPPIAGSLFLGAATDVSPAVLVVLAVAMIGLAQGSEGDFLAFFTIKMFGPGHFSAIWAILSMAALLGSACGGIAFSYIFDHFGSYALGCYVGGFLYLQSAALIMAAGWLNQKRHHALAGIGPTDTK